jgi:hypothetical protein
LGDVIASYDYHFTGYYLVAIRGQPAFSVVGMENNSHWKYSTEYTQQRKSTEKVYEITSTFFLPSIFQIIKIKHVTVYRRKMPHFDVLIDLFLISDFTLAEMFDFEMKHLLLLVITFSDS